MKFLFFTDLHLSGMVPRHRTDDYTESLLKKLDEVYSMALDEGCDFLTFGGDFFDYYKVYSYDMIGKAMDIICKSPLYTFVIIGQHDIYGYNPATLNLSTLHFMIRNCSMMKVLWEPVNLGEITLYPCHVWDDPRKIAMSVVDSSCYNVLLAHHLLSAKKAPFEVILTSSLVPCNFQMVLSGDLHTGFPVHSISETTFVNPGSLARQTVSDIKRWPQVAIIEVLPDLPVNVELRRLSCARDGIHVFGETVAEVVRDETRLDSFDASAFVEGMEKFEAESVDIFALVEKIGMKKGVKNEILTYIREKKQNFS